MANKFFNFAEKQGKTLNLRIYGVIGQESWFSKRTSSDEVNKILEEYGDIDEINLRITSPGGSVTEGCAIYDSLKRHKAKVNVYIDGSCASIATVIAMAGDKILMSNVGSMMIHNPMTFQMGEAKKFQQTVEALETLKETIINAYVTKSKLNREEISELMDKETYMTAEKALEYGFITEIDNLNNPQAIINQDINFMNNFINQEINKKDKEEVKMDKVTLLAQFPELFNSIKNEGALEERGRIQALDAMLDKTKGKGSEIISKAKYEDVKAANEIAMELIDILATTDNSEPKNEEKKEFVNNFKDVVNEAKEDLDGIEHKEEKTDKEKVENFVDEIANIANEEGGK